jgi:hypothetical protein
VLPHFGELREVVGCLRRLYRSWADELAHDYTRVCKTAGFLPSATLRQRSLFEQVVVPMTLGGERVAPIKALLNNQETRLGTYAEMVGLRRFVWHGDISDAEKSKFRKDPAEILMTTPESLEVMLVSPRPPGDRVFEGLRLVVIDEIHAIAGTDRGAHCCRSSSGWLLSRVTTCSALGCQRRSATRGTFSSGCKAHPNAKRPSSTRRGRRPSARFALGFTVAPRPLPKKPPPWRRERERCSSARAAPCPRPSQNACGAKGLTFTSITAQ